MTTLLDESIDILAEQFPNYDWTYHEVDARPGDGGKEVTFRWFGDPTEEVMVCIHRGKALHEQLHRHDFYFFNYAYQGQYDALSENRHNLITVREGELYMGQPFNGYALRGNKDEEIIIVGVLIQKEAFYRDFLQALSADAELARFFLEPRKDVFADGFRHLHQLEPAPVRPLLETMIIEYAHKGEGTQQILKALALALAEMTARQYRAEHPVREAGLAYELDGYFHANLASASLGDAAQRLGYHPNYLSSLVKQTTGETFQARLKRLRLERAQTLLSATDLAVEEIAAMVGYPNTSNFYRAFKDFTGHSPRSQEA